MEPNSYVFGGIINKGTPQIDEKERLAEGAPRKRKEAGEGLMGYREGGLCGGRGKKCGDWQVLQAGLNSRWYTDGQLSVNQGKKVIGCGGGGRNCKLAIFLLLGGPCSLTEEKKKGDGEKAKKFRGFPSLRLSGRRNCP